MNLEEFHQLIDDMSAEGGASDALIPAAVRHAVLFLERNFPFRYMNTEIQINYPVATELTDLTLGSRIKTIWSGETRKVNGKEGITEIGLLTTPNVRLDIVELEDKLPVYHYFDSTDVAKVRPLLLTSEAIDLHFYVAQYTSWPTSAYSSFTHFLIDRLEDVLASQAMTALSAMLRDTDLGMFYNAKRVEEVKSAIVADFLYEAGSEIV